LKTNLEIISEDQRIYNICAVFQVGITSFKIKALSIKTRRLRIEYYGLQD